jgi:hypothetical protein
MVPTHAQMLARGSGSEGYIGVRERWIAALAGRCMDFSASRRFWRWQGTHAGKHESREYAIASEDRKEQR